MSRKAFRSVSDVPVVDIMLDIGNARIRAGHDQNDCIARILRKEDQLMALMADIAENGLTTMPILVRPTGDGKWTVMDGNRRVTALKLLKNVDMCPDERLKPRIRLLQKTWAANISEVVDVLESDDEEAIAREVLARHSGAAGGVGQLDWSAYLRTVYLLNHGHPAEYRRPGQYALWAEQHDIFVPDDFPISSLQRFFNTDNLRRLGFDVVDEELVLNMAEHTVKRMAQAVLTDFETGRQNVDGVRTPSQAIDYINVVRHVVGLPAAPPPAPPSAAPAPSESWAAPPAPGTPSPMPPTVPGSPAFPSTPPAPPPSAALVMQRAAPSPKTPSWDRPKLFGRYSPNIAIPDAEGKAKTIVAELRTLSVKGNGATPLAVAMLLRHLIEASDKFYRDKHRIGDQNGLAKNVLASAKRMRDSGVMEKAEFDIVERLSTTTSSDLLHIEMLQKMMHKDTHTPDYQLLNNFWDSIAPFVRLCWVK